jgi:long-chain acyl-CoA synthetase
VYEQVLYRLAGARWPVTYHDITASGVRTRHAEEVRHEICAATAALRGLGIRTGDRVAIVGLNSSRYLSLDVAIGLVGAASVPLYYTSPPAEIDALVRSSNARLLLIGAPQVLARANELHCAVPMVSFGTGAPVPAGVLGWASFLALGADAVAMPAPVGFVTSPRCATRRAPPDRPKG